MFGVSIVPISVIFLLDFETVLTVCYFFFFHFIPFCLPSILMLIRSILDYAHNQPMFAGLSVNSDGQQCHHNQQYGQPPLNSNH